MLSCVCILIYTSQERRTHGAGLGWGGLARVGYNKRKNRTNQKRDTCSFFCCRPENIAVGPDLLLLLLLEAFCCCYCGFCNFHAWPKHPHTHSQPVGQDALPLPAMQIPHGFSIFSNHFQEPLDSTGPSMPGHLSGHYAASRTLIKQITAVPLWSWRWLRPELPYRVRNTRRPGLCTCVRLFAAN